MSFRRVSCLLLMCLGVVATTPEAAHAEPGRRSADGAWTTLAPEQLHALQRAGATPRVRPDRFHAVAVEPDTLAALLAQAPAEDLAATARSADAARIMLPTPDGEFVEFAVVDSPVFEEGLFETMAAMGFPQRTYRVWRVDNPAETGRIDFGGPAGFFAMIRGDEGSWYVDPFWMGDDRLHVSYWRRDFAPTDSHLAWRCLTDGPAAAPPMDLGDAGATARGGSANLRTYRFACAATGEYTQFHGGTVSAGQAAVTTMTNRVNSVYEIDLGIRLILVANNTSVVYTNASTDPYTGNDAEAMLAQVRTDLNAKIGEANYDAGHVVSGNGSGGIAGALGNICRNGTGGFASPHKAQGATTWNSPVGDPFDIDYVAHELGHQFAGHHPFAFCGGGPGDESFYAFEPGSGSTIMAYAGICGADSNLQSNSDAMFHIMNIIQIDDYLAGLGGGCATNVPTGNANAPAISAGTAVSIPVGTPFELTPASFGDADGDTLTFTWEQVDPDDATPVAPANAPTSLVGPVYRSRLPSTSPTRAIPRIQEVRTGATPPFGERLSTVARSFTWRVTARDNNPGVGRVTWSQRTVTTVAGTPFAVTSPNGGESVGGATTVTWQAGNTASAPINASAVDMYLSTDGGLTFPTLLAENVPNTGSAQVSFNGPATSTARLKIKGRGNIFYDISNANFTIAPPSTPTFGLTAPPTPQDTTGNGNGNGAIDPGESDVRLPISVTNTSGVAATGVTGTLSSLTGTATVTTAGPATYGNLAPGASAAGSSAFAISVDPSHPCGAPINLRLTVSSTTGGTAIDFSVATGRPGRAVLFADGFEGATLSNWALAEGRWAARSGASSDASPRTGTFLGSFEPGVEATTSARLVTPTVANPSEMTFWHTYAMEQADATGAYDGLILEYSTNGGSTFTQVPGAWITTGTYTHTTEDDCEDTVPDATPCWSGGSVGAMQQVVVNLSALASESNVRLSFRYFEDCVVAEDVQGWFLDDVEVTGGGGGTICDPPGGGSVSPTQVLNYLLGVSNDPAGLDANGDGRVDIGDLIFLVNAG